MIPTRGVFAAGGTNQAVWRARERHPLPSGPEDTPGQNPDAEATLADGGRYLRCRSCGRRIAPEAARCAVMGQHHHTFCNPHGLVFELGCFEHAPGCLGVGDLSPEFTWFPGYAWQPTICRGCRLHLGWRYVAAHGAAFFGLILPLLEPETGDDASP